MKRDPEKLRAWQQRSKPMTRGGNRTRSRLNPTNPERKAKTFARNFGTRGEAIREMECLVQGCWRPTEAAHLKGARGMGGANGDRRGLGPLCRTHHEESGERRTTQRFEFEERHQLDLEAEADRIAIELDDAGHE